jgi:hypothetical protein
MVVVRLIANFSAARSFLGSTETKPALAHCLDAGRAGRGRTRRSDRRAPSDPCAARPNEAPAGARGRAAGYVCRRCLVSAPATSGGTRAPIERRSRRVLCRGSRAWVKRSRDVEPH